MGRTLLVGHPGVTWREWLKANRQGRDLIILDPADANHTIPGRLTLLRGDKAIASRFYGSLDPIRAPHVMVGGLAELLAQAEDDALIQTWPYRPSPLAHQLLLLIAQIAKPQIILTSVDSLAPKDALPIGPESVDLEAAFPVVVASAQRKAQWLKLLENCRPHELNLTQIAIDGARLGSGSRLTNVKLEGAKWTEHIGSSFFAVVEGELSEQAVARTLDHLHATRAHFASPDAYDGLLCTFAKANGEDFGYGIVRTIDFGRGVVDVLNTAEAPAPVRILRLGSLKLNESGSELGEVRPWQV